jgi:nucleoid-associated protein YgaU
MKASAIALMVMVGGLLAACAQNQAKPDASANSQAVALQPTPGLKANERLQVAIKALQNGDVERAKVELTVFVAEQPKNKVGTGLLAQIETSADKYFPRDNFTVALKQGESLSNVAATYLGDPLQFYALARYNQIQNPSKVTVGQSLRIPKTPTAVAALAKGPTSPAAPQPAALPSEAAAASAAVPLPPAPSQDDPRRAAAQGR